MEFSEYAKIEAEHWSGLRHMAVSPLHYLDAKSAPRTDSPQMAFGRAAHCATLEPDRFPLDFIARPEGLDRRTKDGKAAFAELEASGRDILTAEDYARALAAAAAVRGHKAASQYLADAECEVSLRWTDEATGLACKGRADFVTRGWVGDLKFLRAVTPRRLPSLLWDSGYYHQLAFYRRGILAVRRHEVDAVIIAVESGRPHDVVARELSGGALKQADREVSALLARVAECRAAGEWPGQSPDPEVIDVPTWAIRPTDANEQVRNFFEEAE